MPKLTIIFGLVLIGIGLVAYFGSDLSSGSAAAESGSKKATAITGLAIPGGVGLLFLISGLVALKDSVRKLAMHTAATIGLLGALATVGKGSADVYRLISGGDVNGRAMTFVWLMAVVCIVYVVLCIKSFKAARRNRVAAESATS